MRAPPSVTGTSMREADQMTRSHFDTATRLG